jgi:hypothetical protein
MPRSCFRHRGCWVTALACALVFAAGPARADTADELAHKHFESGAAYLEQSDYESALREFNKAYELSKRAEILLNVATVNERMNKLKDAIAALEQYLAEAPQGEHAETVRIRVENLKKRVAAEPTPSPPPPAPATAAPTPTSTATSSSSPTPTSTPPPTSSPSRTPAIILFATGGALAVGSIVTGILAKGEHSNAEETCSPNCTDDQLSTGRTLAITSTVLTGAAVVAASVGAVLFFGASSNDHAATATPRVAVGATPQGVSATARWRF